MQLLFKCFVLSFSCNRLFLRPLHLSTTAEEGLCDMPCNPHRQKSSQWCCLSQGKPWRVWMNHRFGKCYQSPKPVPALSPPTDCECTPRLLGVRPRSPLMKCTRQCCNHYSQKLYFRLLMIHKRNCSDPPILLSEDSNTYTIYALPSHYYYQLKRCKSA